MEENVKFQIIYDEDIELSEEEIKKLANEYPIVQEDGVKNAND